MGKRLIINGADFSQNAIDNVSPPSAGVWMRGIHESMDLLLSGTGIVSSSVPFWYGPAYDGPSFGGKIISRVDIRLKNTQSAILDIGFADNISEAVVQESNILATILVSSGVNYLPSPIQIPEGKTLYWHLQGTIGQNQIYSAPTPADDALRSQILAAGANMGVNYYYMGYVADANMIDAIDFYAE